MMIKQDKIFDRIAEALLLDYSSVYYVNAISNEYCWYLVNPELHSLSLERTGDDFFTEIVLECSKMIYEEDQHTFIENLQKEKLLAAMKKGSMQNTEFRVMINQVPTWHALRLIRGWEEGTDYFVLGVINIDEAYRRKIKEKEIEQQNEIYNQITSSLAEQYDTLYYVDIDTSTYVEISSTDEFKKLNVPATGNDFFAESRRSIRKYVHQEDQKQVISIHYKDIMLKNLENRRSFSLAYRLVADGVVKHIRHTEIMSRDRKHLIICIENIDAEVREKLALKESQERSVTYTQIAESLASHYDLIYYVDCLTSPYCEFSTKKRYGELAVREEGDDFFETSLQNVERVIYPEDRERMKHFLDKDHLISGLEDHRQVSIDYRMLIKGGRTQYTRLSVTYSSDRTHFIIWIENREESVRREKEHLQALYLANKMARRDELTGTKNKTAYQEMEKTLQKLIDSGKDEPFGILVSDINELKLINDTKGHRAGDEHIRDACRMICRIFSHSPVFRIGGDEFVVVLRGQDFRNRESLTAALRSQVEGNNRTGEGPVVASGLAEYRLHQDSSVADVFIRADSRMYDDKTHLKEMKLIHETHTLKELAGVRMITEDRKKTLDALFQSFEVVAEGTYVYLCDMKYDFSR